MCRQKDRNQAGFSKRCVHLLPRYLLFTLQVLSSLGYHVVTFDYRGEFFCKCESGPSHCYRQGLRCRCEVVRAACGALTLSDGERGSKVVRGQSPPVCVLCADEGHP